MDVIFFEKAIVTSIFHFLNSFTLLLSLLRYFIGNPIANDPCYGGELFYNEPFKRERALNSLRTMRAKGQHPLSKVGYYTIRGIDTQYK